MQNNINKILEPINHFLIKNKEILSKITLLVAVLGFLCVFLGNKNDFYTNALTSATISFYLLVILLWIPIPFRLFGINIFRTLTGFRKELGIVMGVFAFPHFVSMIPMLSLYFEMSPIVAFCGFWAQILTFVLLLTSNNFSQKLLGKKWKRLHRSVYLIYLFVVIQIALTTSGNHLVIIGIMIVYFIAKICEWRNIQFYKESTKTFPK